MVTVELAARPVLILQVQLHVEVLVEWVVHQQMQPLVLAVPVVQQHRSARVQQLQLVVLAVLEVPDSTQVPVVSVDLRQQLLLVPPLQQVVPVVREEHSVQVSLHAVVLEVLRLLTVLHKALQPAAQVVQELQQVSVEWRQQLVVAPPTSVPLAL